MPEKRPRRRLSSAAGEGSAARTNRTAAELAAVVAAAASTDDPRLRANGPTVSPLYVGQRLLQLEALAAAGHLHPDELALLKEWYLSAAPAGEDGQDALLFSEDVGLFTGSGYEKQYCRLEISRAGRVIVRALGLPEQPRVVDVDMVTAVERLLKASRV